MSKALKRLALALAAASLCASAATAQTATAEQTKAAAQALKAEQTPTPDPTPATAPPEWVAVAPAGEGFTVRMPKQPVTVEQGVQAHGMNAFGFRYAAAPDDATTFVVWTMKGSHARGPLGGGDRAITFSHGVAPYLDGVAELTWELLITPEYERLERKGVTGRRLAELGLGMTYRRGFELSGLPAREYSVTLEGERGHVYVCSEGPQVYVVAALGADAGDARLRQFVDSFALKSAKPSTPAVGGDPSSKTGSGTGSGAGTGGNVGSTVPPAGPDTPVDYTKPFRPLEVVKKATITFKPEPGFTEEARKFNVTGVVRLRGILHSSGEMRNLVVIKGLPHGLTERSIAAALRIRFNPAQKDGREVSQYVVLEYNYNIY